MITTKTTTSFIVECLNGVHLPTDTYKVALIKTGHTGQYNTQTTNYGVGGLTTPAYNNLGSDEVVAAGYPAGGLSLTAPSINTYNNSIVAFDFADPAALNNVTISADGGLIYNVSKGGKAVAVFAFTNAPVTSVNGLFSVDFPVAGATTSLIRFNT